MRRSRARERDTTMKGALVYTWSAVVPGRERKALAFMSETNRLLDRYVTEGRVEDYTWYLSGNDAGGLVIVRGELEKLGELQNEPEQVAANVRGGLLNQDFRWGMYVTGETVDLMVALFEQEIAALG
jgi:hypothetical protein